MVPNGRLLEHKWGDTTLTYSPIALTEDNPEQTVPVFSVAVNKEHEPYSDLQVFYVVHAIFSIDFAYFIFQFFSKWKIKLLPIVILIHLFGIRKEKELATLNFSALL